METLTQFTNRVEGTLIDYDGVWWSQCVDLIKAFTNNVYWVRLWTFGWSALTGWANTSNTFKTEEWEKVFNEFGNVEQFPSEGDIVFFKWGEFWHCAIVIEADGTELIVLDQNTGNGDGVDDDDRIKVQKYSYNGILGWYKLKDKHNNAVEWLTTENIKLKEALIEVVGEKNKLATVVNNIIIALKTLDK